MKFPTFVHCIFPVLLYSLDSSWDGRWKYKKTTRGAVLDIIASLSGNRKYQESYNKCRDFQPNFTVSDV